MINKLIVLTVLSLAVHADTAQAVDLDARDCGVYKDIVDTLQGQGENRLGWGMANVPQGVPQQIFEVFSVSTADNTPWTIVKVYANGRGCVIAHGVQWQTYEYRDPRGITIEELLNP